jgi:acyl-CoA dehydrogenase
MIGADLAVIEYLLQSPLVPPARIAVFPEWKRTWMNMVPLWETPVDRALAGGFAADRPAWAFAAGYQAALQCLMPTLDNTRIAAICITEKGGPHPARIQCRLTPDRSVGGRWRLDGSKVFVSGAEGAEILFVAATTGKTHGGRNVMRMVTVPTDSDGVTVTALPSLGMVPEMPHGKVRLEAVCVADAALWPGDGYIGAIKPFRTIEDVYVTGAFLAWVFAIGRRSGWPASVLETMLPLMVTIRKLALASPLEPHVHLVLGGLLAQVRDFLQKIDPLWQRVDVRQREWWQRDRKILDIAETARQRRLDAARAYYRNA